MRFNRAIILSLGLFIVGLCAGQAHVLFTACIQHRIAVTIGAKYMDVTVQLTFFEEGSEHEREHIDANSDGRLSRAEIDAYLQELEPKLAKLVTMRIGGRPVALAPLRATEIDLLGQDRVVRGHHRLTLYYFAPTPQKLAPQTELIVEERLWPNVRALGSIQVEGKDGCRLEALPAGDPMYPPAKENEVRAFKARVLSPPTSPGPTPARDRNQARQTQSNNHTTPYE